MGLAKRSWPEIVSRLGFMMSHVRFDWLRSGCVVVGLFFGSDTVMVRVAE
jgi:hypothetical protein